MSAQLLTTNEMAAKLNVHRITVMRMATDGRIPYIKISATEYRYEEDAVMEKLRSTTRKSA